jgi:hypothetical protein
MNQLSVSHEDLRQAVEEQEAMVLGLQQAAETARKALEAEKKHVEGESPFIRLSLVGSVCLGSAPNFLFFVYGFQAYGPPWVSHPISGGKPDASHMCARI